LVSKTGKPAWQIRRAFLIGRTELETLAPFARHVIAWNSRSLVPDDVRAIARNVHR
jgi:hypothetical protein